jgi:thioredoxin 1
MQEVKVSEFETEVLKSDVPVVVDFWADWCMPCRMLAPTLENFAQLRVGKVKVVKVNIEDNQELAAEYKINMLPTLVVFKDGKEINRVTGIQSKAQLASLV